MLWDKKIVTWKELGMTEKVAFIILLIGYFFIAYFVSGILDTMNGLWNALASAFCFMFFLQYYFMHGIRMLNYYGGWQGFTLLILIGVAWIISLLQLFNII